MLNSSIGNLSSRMTCHGCFTAHLGYIQRRNCFLQHITCLRTSGNKINSQQYVSNRFVHSLNSTLRQVLTTFSFLQKHPFCLSGCFLSLWVQLRQCDKHFLQCLQINYVHFVCHLCSGLFNFGARPLTQVTQYSCQLFTSIQHSAASHLPAFSGRLFIAVYWISERWRQ